MEHLAELIDLEHVRRARRLVPILVDRFGVGWFLADGGRDAGLRSDRLDRCVELAGEWIARRSGRAVGESLSRRMRRWVVVVVHHRIASGAAAVR